ncbi:MAG: hypothetical protein AAFY59_02165 [Pseudomonadota bacterium]
MTRYAVLRVPNNGPKALIAEPNDFATEAEALARIASVEAAQLQIHHTHLEIHPYSGDLRTALAAADILY